MKFVNSRNLSQVDLVNSKVVGGLRALTRVGICTSVLLLSACAVPPNGTSHGSETAPPPVKVSAKQVHEVGIDLGGMQGHLAKFAAVVELLAESEIVQPASDSKTVSAAAVPVQQTPPDAEQVKAVISKISQGLTELEKTENGVPGKKLLALTGAFSPEQQNLLAGILDILMSDKNSPAGR